MTMISRTATYCLLSAAAGAGLALAFASRSGSGAPATTGPVKRPAVAESAAFSPAAIASKSGKSEAAADRWQSLRSGVVLPPESMVAAVDLMLSENDTLASMEAFTSLLRELSPDNAQAGWDALSSRLRGPDAMRYLPLFAHVWGTLDGPGALAAMEKSGDRGEVMARLNAMGGWASKDADAALAWLASQKSAEGGENRKDLKVLQMGLLRGIAMSDPAKGTEMLSSLEGKEQGALLAMMTHEQYLRSPDAAWAWAGSLSDPELRAKATSDVMRKRADADPAKAAAWLSSRPELLKNPEATGAVAREWAARNPAEAVPWIQSLPEGPARNEAWEDALRSWSRKDPQASSTYLNQMPPGAERDAAVSSLARSIAREEPAAAIQWAGTIRDPEAREAAMVRSVQLWRGRDDDAAAQWIQSSGLSPEVQQRMMEPVKIKDGKPGKTDFGQKPWKRPR